MGNTRLHVKGIMLDLDGTILDTRPAYIEAAKVACATTAQCELKAAASLEIPKRMEQRMPLIDLVKGDSKAFLQAYRKAFYDVSLLKTEPMPHVAEILDALVHKAKLAVITMRFTPAKAVRQELKQFHLDKYFTDVVTALDTHKPKPNPEALIKAAAAMEVQMCESVIVGDSTVDVKAGQAAGAKTVAVLSGLYTRKELEKAGPDYIIRDVSELPALIA